MDNVETILIAVKEMLDYGDNDEADSNLKRYIKSIIDYMKKAGVPDKSIMTEDSFDVIALAVEDLKTNKVLSDYVRSRITQLSMVSTNE